MATTVLNKGLDLGLAIVILRTLGPTDVGRYTWAVLIVGYFDILINFGLGVLITRDVAREPSAAGRYLGGALLTRSALWLIAMLLALLIAGPFASYFAINQETSAALVVLTLGIGISNLAGLVSALFNARELMEYPAMVTVFTTALKVALGVAALALGYAIVGLAVVSVVVNLATAIVLVALLFRLLGAPRLVASVPFSVKLLGLAYALMLNNLLATVFFRVDGLILRAVQGDDALGWYSAAYRFIDGLNVIPSSLTLALFPVLSVLAARSPGIAAVASGADAGREADGRVTTGASLVRATELALKVLLSLALPIAVGLRSWPNLSCASSRGPRSCRTPPWRCRSSSGSCRSASSTACCNTS
jgi:O-antigen/teichoic acid export membrane protein